MNHCQNTLLPGFVGLHHLAIICSDYQRSKHFYVNILGLHPLNEQYRTERDSWKLDLALPDGSQLELFSFPEPPPRPSYPEACGLRHLALAVSDLQAAVAYLNAQGVPTETPRIDQSTGRWFTFFADPDGLPLELYENTEKRERPFSGDNPGFPISSSVSRESSLEPTPCPASPLPL